MVFCYFSLFSPYPKTQVVEKTNVIYATKPYGNIKITQIVPIISIVNYSEKIIAASILFSLFSNHALPMILWDFSPFGYLLFTGKFF